MFASSLLLMHVLVSAAAALFTLHLEEHRLPNIRNLDGDPPEHVQRLIASFIRSRLDDRKTVIVLGSSFSWGYSWPSRNIYSRHLQDLLGEERYNVINLSKIGGLISHKFDVFNAIEDMKIRIDYIIIEVSPANLREDINKNYNVTKYDKLINLFEYKIPYFDFFIFFPSGVEFIRTVYNQYRYFQRDSSFSFVPLPEGYFLKDTDLRPARGKVGGWFDEIARLAGKTGAKSYLFFAPTPFSELPKTGHDSGPVKAAYALLHEICSERAGDRMRCLDLSGFQDSADYRDVSHLNQRGHASFARRLLRSLEIE